jgi:hypothetical protein
MTDPIDLEQVFAESSQDPFWAIRGKAIQSYANLEQSLCRLFANFSGMPMDVAAIVFFKIVNAGTLHGILEKLLKKKHGATYSIFWNSYAKTIRQVTEVRNHVVHWNVSTTIDDSGFSGLSLIPPNIWEYGPNSPAPITTADLLEFITQCDFLTRLGNMFHMILTPHIVAGMDAGTVQTWRDIFLQPVTYPPPGNHPLCPKTPVPGNQPPPSPASPQS